LLLCVSATGHWTVFGASDRLAQVAGSEAPFEDFAPEWVVRGWPEDWTGDIEVFAWKDFIERGVEHR